MMKAIKANKKVCIFPNTLLAKDINDMAKMRYDVNYIIHNNVFSGYEAQAQLSYWRKC